MPSPHDHVPTLAVVVPVVLVALGAVLVLLHRRAALTVPRVLSGAALCVYGAGIVANTLLPFRLGETADRPGWTAFVHLVPLVGSEPRDLAQNVLVFLPLGVLLPVIGRVRSARRVLLLGLLLSLTMEVVQLVNAVTGHGGHVADVNDLLANAVGAPLGYGLLRGATVLPPVARMVTAATWPPRRSAAEPGERRG